MSPCACRDIQNHTYRPACCSILPQISINYVKILFSRLLLQRVSKKYSSHAREHRCRTKACAPCFLHSFPLSIPFKDYHPRVHHVLLLCGASRTTFWLSASLQMQFASLCCRKRCENVYVRAYVCNYIGTNSFLISASQSADTVFILLLYSLANILIVHIDALSFACACLYSPLWLLMPLPVTRYMALCMCSCCTMSMVCVCSMCRRMCICVHVHTLAKTHLRREKKNFARSAKEATISSLHVCMCVSIYVCTISKILTCSHT